MKLAVLFLSFLLVCFLSINTSAQVLENFECIEVEDPYEGTPQRGGRYFTEQGEIRAMVVFVQFAGDSTSPNNTNWPVTDPPQPPIYSKQVLDSTLTPQISDTSSLSNYFREMSFNKLKIYGDAYFVVTDSTKQWYKDQQKTYEDVNRDVLHKLDEQVNYSHYDTWTFGTYEHSNTSDGIVDMIIMVYREAFKGEINLYNGIAVLFYGNDLLVDDETMTIESGFPGSGVTTDSGIHGKKTHWISHEIGHLLLGGGHPGYNKEPQIYAAKGFWGLLFSNSWLVNAYDRHWLRWSDVTDLSVTDSLDITVSDYLTTGDAYTIEIPETNEAFYIENHQNLSFFDDYVNTNGIEKGLYIYHVKGTGSKPKFDLEIAEGRFDWTNPFFILNPWGGQNPDSIPVFRKGDPNRLGYDGRDAVPTTKGYKHKIYVTDNNSDGEWEKNWRVLGNELDAFKVGYNEIFSPWSNPSSNYWNDSDTSNILIEILNTYTGLNGEDIYNLRIRVVNPENGPPSKPQIIGIVNYDDNPKVVWQSNMEPDIANYIVYRKIDEGGWHSIAQPDDTTYVDTEIDLSTYPSEPLFVSYKVKAEDNQNKLSVPSDVKSINGYKSERSNKFITQNEKIKPDDYKLFNNYPNPFNPETSIYFNLPEFAHVRLNIYTITGEKLITLVNENMKKGLHSIIWNGCDRNGTPVSSGIYIYELKANDRRMVKKMLLTR